MVVRDFYFRIQNVSVRTRRASRLCLHCSPRERFEYREEEGGAKRSSCIFLFYIIARSLPKSCSALHVCFPFFRVYSLIIISPYSLSMMIKTLSIRDGSRPPFPRAHSSYEDVTSTTTVRWGGKSFLRANGVCLRNPRNIVRRPCIEYNPPPPSLSSNRVFFEHCRRRNDRHKTAGENRVAAAVAWLVISACRSCVYYVPTERCGESETNWERLGEPNYRQPPRPLGGHRRRND